MPSPDLAATLDTLERTFGPVEIPAPAEPFDQLVLQHCGYPASDEACAKGHEALARDVGTTAAAILAAKKPKLVKALRAGGMIPEERVERLREVATHARDGIDLRVRKTLKTLPTIGDPGADKILLFSRTECVAAVPSNATQVPARIGFGADMGSYPKTYRSAQQALEAQLPREYEPRIRAYLLLKRHGQTVCKRTAPKCEACPLTRVCAYYAAQASATGKAAR